MDDTSDSGEETRRRDWLSWQSITVGVVAGIATNVVWWFFTSGIPQGLTTLNEFVSDLHARKVAENYSTNGVSTVVSFLAFVAVYTISRALDDIPSMTKTKDLITAVLRIGTRLSAFYLLILTVLYLGGYIDTLETRQNMSSVRPYVSDSTYHSIEARIIGAETSEELRSATATVDSIREAIEAMPAPVEPNPDQQSRPNAPSEDGSS